MPVITDVVAPAAGGLVGGSLLLYGVRVWFSVDKSRQQQVGDIQARLTMVRQQRDAQETEIAALHDQLNQARTDASVHKAHAEGLRVELEWRERQVARLEAEIERGQKEIARLESRFNGG
jgi:septal ring factor EnvC (AmiA/AmiB activator)